MRKLLCLLGALTLLIIPAQTFAQVFSQNQLIVTPFGSNGFVVSTTTANGAKLSATSTPYFANFFSGTGRVNNLTTVNSTSTSATTTNLYISGTCVGCDSFGNSWQLYTNTFSQSALTPTTTLNVHVSGIGTSTFAGGFEAWRQIASPFFHATSTTATTTINNNLTASTTVFGYGGLEVIEGGASYKAVSALRGDDANRGAAFIMERNATTCPLLGCGIWAYRSRGDRTTKIAAQDNDYIFSLYTGAHDGTDYEPAAAIRTEVDGTVANNQMFGRIVFETNNGGQTLSERMRITGAGRVGVGSTTPGSLFSIGGNGTGWNFIDGTSATTTAQGNLYVKGNIRAGGALIADVNLTSSGDATISGNLFTIGTASSTGLIVSGIKSALILNSSTGVGGAYAGSSCTNQFVRSLNGAGTATCASVSLSTDVTGSLALTSLAAQAANTIIANGTGVSAVPVALATSSFYCATCATTIPYASSTASSATNGQWTNSTTTTFYSSLNTILAATGGRVGVGTTTPWASLAVNPIAGQASNAFVVGSSTRTHFLINNTGNVGIASTSPAFPFSINTVASEFYITTTGKIVGVDTTNAWNGRITPTRGFVLSSATTTTWTATTSNAYTFASALTVPFAGTLRSVQCTASSTGAFLGIQPFINQTATTPAYFVASTTRGTILFSGSNTFAKGDTILMYVGTSTAHAALGVNCMFTATETI